MAWWPFLLLICLLLLGLWYRKPSFPLADFSRSCGNLELRVERFKDTRGLPTLQPLEQKSVTVNEWLHNPIAWSGWSSKLKFRKDSEHPVARFLLKWLRANIHLLPRELQRRLQKDSEVEYCLRFTNGEWHYPNHYDCVDNYALVLAGERKVILNNDSSRIRTLRTGEVLYIPSGVRHEFWSKGAASQCNLLFNIDLQPPAEELRRCQADFNTLHPSQQERVEMYKEYS